MEGLFSWVGDLVGWFASFIPRLLIVRATHGGVKFVRGKKVVRIEPGLHIYWPLVTEVQLLAKKRQSDPIPPQNLTTLDGKKVIVKSVIVYRISDPEKALVNTWDHANTVFDVASIAVAQIVTTKNFDRIHKQQHYAIKRELTDLVRGRLRRYGVTVYEAGLVGFSDGQVNMIVNECNENVVPIEDEE